MDYSDSSRRRFVDVPIDELSHAVIEMCVKLGISNSGAGDYNLLAHILNYQQETKEKLRQLNEAFNEEFPS